ncbi:MAG: histidine kinase, partial [Oscillospiraceae bacterium]|nr:histidine kinase [Oscillospiraceae bacterium]
MALMILFSLSAVMIVNRKVRIPAAKLFPMAIILIFMISVSDHISVYAEKIILEKAVPDLDFYRTIRYQTSILSYILRPVIIMVELFLIKPDNTNSKLIIVPALINGIIYASAPFLNGSVFVFDYYNDHFRRGLLGYSIFVTQFLYLILLLSYSVSFFRRSNHNKFVIILVIALIAVITSLFEVNNIITGYATPITALSVFLYYTYLLTVYQQEIHDSVAQKDLRIAQDQIMILRNQIQPHFIFNTLGIIRSLAKRDSAKAVESIDKFSEYLRMNIRAIQSDLNIPFDKELENAEIYLSLAQMDVSRKFDVVYDLRDTDFSIPPLSLEPLIENAVRHGLDMYGGTITVSSFRDGGNIIISVSDSGVGKNNLTEKESGRLGVGIENTRRRLELQCKGRLELDISENGSTARIIIPDDR